jgi:hypothetical protein
MSVPDEQVKRSNINGVCHGPDGGSRHGAASAGGCATVEVC